MKIKGKIALVLDDDPDARKLLRKILEGAGLSVEEASTVQEAMEILEKSSPHIIFTDLRMPGESGFGFLERKKGLPAARLTPVIVVSAVSDKSLIYKAVSLGATDYLTKPVSAAVIIQKTKKALRDYKTPCHCFKKGEKPRVKVSVRGMITGSSEAGMIISAPVMISGETQLSINSKEMKSIINQDMVFTSEKEKSRYFENGMYMTKVRFVGLAEETAKKIRNMIRFWS